MVVHRSLRAPLAAAGSLLVLALSACSLLEGPTPETPERPQTEKPATRAEFVPGGTAEDNLPFFTQVLDDYAEGEQPIEGKPIVDVVAAGGFDKGAMQVSFDRSKTNLVADSIYVAVRVGESCLLGQIGSEERDVTTEVAAAVGPEKNICLIGETRSIDW